tara:strand:+ start:4112 stop:4312 length:201 start_codon:yes stop_codon:yes gene_type:complete
MKNTKRIAFEDALEDNDFGLIIGKDGSLKGMFVPEDLEDEDYVPEEIMQILNKVYGIDMDCQVTIH